jgi:ATP-dependent RNA helicase RhlE
MAKDFTSFDEFKLNRQLWNAIAELGFTAPTPVQQKAIPPILAGQDVVGVAQTGTGKTAAYAIPVIKKINYSQGKNPRAVVLVPTRELTEQVKEQFLQLSKYTDIRIVSIYGGSAGKAQKEELESGADIIISTPKRLMEFYLENVFELKELKILVLDEAERLMDLGFMMQLNKILEVIPRKRQNLLFTATLSPKVERLMEDFLAFPLIIKTETEQAPAPGIDQTVYFTPNIKTKANLLENIISEEKYNRVMVFCKTRHNANSVFHFLERKSGEKNVRVIHGNKAQNTRLNSINDFREGKINYLVSTDVSARGIDITDVDLVINFDVPLIYEDYIHRIGRTGRMFKVGKAITFCSPSDKYHLEKIEKLIHEKIPVKKVPEKLTEEKTSFDEMQKMNIEIDSQRRKEDPEFRGAFHEKKEKRPAKKVREKKKRWKK